MLILGGRGLKPGCESCAGEVGVGRGGVAPDQPPRTRRIRRSCVLGGRAAGRRARMRWHARNPPRGWCRPRAHPATHFASRDLQPGFSRRRRLTPMPPSATPSLLLRDSSAVDPLALACASSASSASSAVSPLPSVFSLAACQRAVPRSPGKTRVTAIDTGCYNRRWPPMRTGLVGGHLPASVFPHLSPDGGQRRAYSGVPG